MFKSTKRSSPALSPVLESLEGRVAPSGMTAASISANAHRAAHVSAKSMHLAATQTSLAVQAGTLGAPIQFTVTVRAAAAAGSPRGTVNLIDHGQVIGTATLTPTTSSSPRLASSQATYTLTQPAGDAAYFFGRHKVSAQFIPSGGFSKSIANGAFTVSQPTPTLLANGVMTATVTSGTGSRIQAGQTANLLYTGYLVNNGKVFDDSAMHGGTPLSFQVGAGQVIPGFDAGTAGMRVGETRIVMIPPSQGYGSTPNGNIPANSTLLFTVKLQSIS